MRPVFVVWVLVFIVVLVVACATPTPALAPSAVATQPTAVATPIALPTATVPPTPTALPAATVPPTPTALPPTVVPPTPQPVTFVMCEAADAVRLDPADLNDAQSAARTEQIFETLVEFDRATTNVRPALAEKWETSTDGKTWTFTLRKNVKFHDGTPFNADAVIWNYARQWDRNHPYHTKEYSTLNWEYWHNVIGWGYKDEMDALMVDIKKIDDFTVQFVLSKASGPFLTNMALFSNGIASPASFDKYKTNAFKNPVGTGPFKLASSADWVKDDRMTLVKNPDWWGDAKTVAIDRLIFRVIKDDSARYRAVKSGECHGMGEGVNHNDVKAAASDPNLQVLSRPPFNVGYLAFNQAAKPLDNPKVRQAISWAINKKAIVDTFYAGNGVPATQFVPPSLWGYNQDIQQTCCDADKAKALLKEAGFEKGFTIDFWYMPDSRPYFPEPKSIAQAIAADLAKVGITANLKTEDWTEMVRIRVFEKLHYFDTPDNLKVKDWEQYKVDARDGQFSGMWLLGWTGANGDPDDFLFTFFDDPAGKGMSTRCCAYYNKNLNDMLFKAASLPEVKAREPLYKQAAALINADMPRVPIAHSSVPLIFSKQVSGYVTNPTGTEFFKSVKLSSTTVPPTLSSGTTNSTQSAVASPPVRIVISNVRDTLFTVSWLTTEATTGQVQLADGTIYGDARGADFSGVTHYVTIAGLQANRNYSFDLVSSGKKYDNTGAHWTVSTGSVLPPFPPDVISGKIKNRNGSNASEAIVFFAIDRQATIAADGVSAPLSTLVTAQDSGTFHVNLREVRAMGDPTRYYGYGTEGDFRTLVMIGAMDGRGNGLAQVDARDARLRTSDPDQLLVIELTPDQ